MTQEWNEQLTLNFRWLTMDCLSLPEEIATEVAKRFDAYRFDLSATAL